MSYKMIVCKGGGGGFKARFLNGISSLDVQDFWFATLRNQ